MRRNRTLLAVFVVLAAVAATTLATATSSGSVKKDKVTLQLKWVTQGQFAGYYAAKAKGLYDKYNLDVSIKTGGPDIIPEQVVLGGQAQFGIDWLPSLMATRDKGGDIVNVAQVFTRSGLTELTWKDTGLGSFCKLKSKKVGVWLGGNEFEQFAALQKCGIDPNSKSQVTIVAQPFDMQLFLKRQIDAASAMTYNELAQVLEVEEPEDRQALPALRPERLPDGEAGHGHARGRDLRQGLLDQGREEPGRGEAVPGGFLRGLGLVP